MDKLHLAAEGDTADRESDVPVVGAREADAPRTNIKGACTIVFALAEVWVMRLEKLPFDVVLLMGRVKPFKKIIYLIDCNAWRTVGWIICDSVILSGQIRIMP